MTATPEQIASLKMQLETAKFRLMGGPDSTNTAVDLTPTLEETMFYVEMNYGRLMRRLAEDD